MHGIGFRLRLLLAVSALFCSTELHAGDDNLSDLVASFRHELYSQDGKGYDDSRAIAEEILQRGEQDNNDSWRVRGLIRLAFVELHFGKWGNEFGKKLDRCEKLLQSFPEDIAHGEFHMYRGFMLGKWQDDIPGGIERLKRAILLAEQLRADGVLSRSFVFSATLYGFLGDENRQLRYAERAYIIGKQIENEAVVMAALTNLVAVLQGYGQSDRALELAQELKRLDPNSGRARWALFCGGKDDEFLEVLKRNAEKHINVPADELTLAMAEYSATHNAYLGEAYRRNGQLEAAEKSFRIATDHFRISKNKLGRVEFGNQRRLVEIMMIRDDLERLNALVQKLDDGGHVSAANRDSCHHIANAYERVGEYEQATNWLNRHIKLSEELASLKHQNLRSAAQDYWESELQARNQIDVAERQKQRSLYTNYLLGLSIIGILAALAANARFQKRKLAKLVDERTESLIEANKRSEAANEAKSEFLAQVNHEVRNPLTAILAYCDLLGASDKGNKSEQEELATGLKAASRHLLSLVDDVLVVSSIENREIKSNELEFDLRDTISDVEKMTLDLAKEKSLEFECRIESEFTGKLIGDETKLRQIVVNLVSNAIKFTDHGKVSALIWLSKPSHDQVTLTIKVSDSGPGIPDELLPNLFTKFARGSHKKDGTGLGLYICKMLTEHLGGSIDVASDPSGSEFSVSLPFKTSRRTQPIDESPICEEGRRRILIVDDKETIRSAMCRQIQALGFESKSSENLDSTLRLIQEWQPTMVLLDLRMPDHDGFEVLSSIKTRNASIHVVAMTGDATDEMRRKCDDSGFDGFLTKPFSMAELLDRVEK